MEGRKCCVNSCRQLSDEQQGGRVPKRLTLYCFPCWRKNEGDYISTLTMRRRAAWVAAVGQGDITFSHIPTSMRVCSRHFHSGKPAYEVLESDPDWVPSLELGHYEEETQEGLKEAEKKTLLRSPRGEPEPAAARGGGQGGGAAAGGGEQGGGAAARGGGAQGGGAAAGGGGAQGGGAAARGGGAQGGGAAARGGGAQGGGAAARGGAQGGGAAARGGGAQGGGAAARGGGAQGGGAAARGGGARRPRPRPRPRGAAAGGGGAGEGGGGSATQGGGKGGGGAAARGGGAQRPRAAAGGGGAGEGGGAQRPRAAAGGGGAGEGGGAQRPRAAAAGGGGAAGGAAAAGGVPVRAALCPWREARSLLQSVLKPEEDVRRRPADQTPEETELPAKEAGLRDFFRESLRAALKGASRTLPDQQTSRVRPETSRVRPETSRVRPETSSPESCVSCERLQRSVMVLKEELSRHTGLQVGVQEEAPDWAEPLEGDDDAEVESSSGSSKVSTQLQRAPRFQKSWLHKFWFLRYSAAQNLMWCYVCRLHTDRNHPGRGMVRGTSILKLHNIKQHTASLNHRNNVQRHMELGLSDTAPRLKRR